MDQNTISKIYERALKKGFGGNPMVMYKKYGPPVPVGASEAYKIMAKLESVLSGHTHDDSKHIKEVEGKLHLTRQSPSTFSKNKLKEQQLDKAPQVKDRHRHGEGSKASSQARQLKVKDQHCQHVSEKRTRHAIHSGMEASFPHRSKQQRNPYHGEDCFRIRNANINNDTCVKYAGLRL